MPMMAMPKPRRSVGRQADHELLTIDDLAKELILQAAMLYHCLLSTEDTFPDRAQEAEMVKVAWEQVNQETGLVPLRLMPDIAKIVSGHLLLWAILIGIQIKAHGSQAHGEIKEKTKSLVEGLFGFDSSHGRKAIAANRKWVEELKCERGFIYKVRISFPFIITFYLIVTIFRPFPSILIQTSANARGCTNIWSFRKRSTSCGSRTSGMKAFGTQICPNQCQFLQLCWFWLRYVGFHRDLIDLLIKLCQIEANIDEWLTGIKAPVTFWANEYRLIYHSHLEGLKEYGKHTAKHDLLGRLQRLLFNYGWYVVQSIIFNILAYRIYETATMQV
jgi:uncharacterized protein DUF6532